MQVVKLLEELKSKIEKSTISTEELEQCILHHKRVFITGAGRSGLVGKLFAMRLMHIGKSVYISGDVTTPKITAHDLLLAITGSGSTSTVVAKAKIAKSVGAMVFAITSQKSSTIEMYSSKLMRFNMRSKESKQSIDNIMPLGTAFELSVLLTLETIIANLMQKLHIDENYLRDHHTNLE